MIVFIIAITSIFIWTGGQCCQFSDTFDPCSSENHKPFPYMPDRCPDCEYLSNDRNDLYDLDHDTWYGTEFNMTTRYVSPYGCGTRIPIWMNGTIPMIGEDVVSRTACVATFERLCALSYSIKVKRCDSSNTVYCLDNLPSSIQQRYCFDFDPRIFTTRTSTRTSPKLPTTRPPRIDGGGTHIFEDFDPSIFTSKTLTTTSAKFPTTTPPRTDGGGIHIFNETGVQGWVIAVIAALSITIVGLVAIIVVIFRQFRKNHKSYNTFPDHEMPPPYNQVIGFIPMNEKAVTTVVNVKLRY